MVLFLHLLNLERKEDLSLIEVRELWLGGREEVFGFWDSAMVASEKRLAGKCFARMDGEYDEPYGACFGNLKIEPWLNKIINLHQLLHRNPC